MPIPVVAAYEFDITKSNPQFVRHIPSGSPAYVRTLGSGTLGEYMFWETKSDQGYYESYQTKVVVFRVTTTGNIISNMKFWTPDDSVLSQGSSYYQFAVSGTWLAFPQFATSGQVNMVEVPTTLPTSQNLFKQDGGTSITGILDEDVSQYIYASLCLEETYPNGRHGAGDGSFGRFEHRVTYDYT
jgi:hypothetical protein